MIRAALQRWRGDRRGVAAIEFALIAPVVVLMVVGTIEISHMLTVQVSLDGAVAEAARVAAVRLDQSEDTRDTTMRDYVTKRMSAFPIANGQSVSITTKVYRTFGSSYPEGFTDTNGNGRYDGPFLLFAGEPFDDRNKNGVRDLASQITGKLGGPGDVVAYTAEFPAALYFDYFSFIAGADGFTLKASTVVRNEPVKSSGT
ncbi:TadE/TadG family type IV pilus assembly protein [Novosphingobium sp. 9U]|uniref:TadE/TadG family type IV pilus assembly protein n=1 Tax=Novosphingobium sp. 9U TaxID=2653158 RepID=UPI0012F1D19F|nr:TadE/TadG family type IV pilus assembly protein [Novosphingobium sp. 9U]VWX54346.1 TadE-like protein [Novosphingobium sp. 9U]